MGGGEVARAPGDDAAEGSVERVSRALASRIAAGDFADDNLLPNIKSLRSRMGASYRTVKEAVERLAAQGWVSRCGRRYRVTPHPASSPGSRILCIVEPHMLRNIDRLSTGVQRLVRHLEQQCARSGTRLEFVPFNTVHETFSGSSTPPWEAQGRYPILGVVVNTLYMQNAQRCLRHIEQLSTRGIPVSVLDESGDSAFDAITGKAAPVSRFGISFTATPGAVVGQYCLAQGHREIAYVSLYNSRHPGWAMERLRGLRQAFESAGCGAGVHAFMPGKRLFPKRLTAEERTMVKRLARQLGGVRTEPFPELARTVGGSLAAQAEWVVADALALREVEPPVDQILQHEAISAIVAANEHQALNIIHHLRERSVAVPARMSVIGFDNLAASIPAGLTSYDFNEAGIAHAAIHPLLAPRRQRPGRPAGFTEVPGYIVERGSVARIPG